MMDPISFSGSGLLKITIGLLKERRDGKADLIIISVDPSLYILQVMIDGARLRVVDELGMNLTYRNTTSAKRALRGLKFERVVLEHQSSYDEMVGLEPRESSNTLQVSTSLVFDE